MKPVAKYKGGKWNIAQHYGPPTRKVLVEPFAGFAGYALYYDWPDTILVDSYDVVANIWKWLIEEATPDRIRAVSSNATCREQVRGPKPLKDLVGFWFGRGDVRPRHHMPPSIINAAKGLYWSEGAKQRIIDALPLIKHWKIIHGDYTLAPDSDDTFTFIDPPYAVEGINYPRGCVHMDYQALAKWCKQRNAGIVCESAAADWLPFQPLTTVRTRSGKLTTEGLYRI